MMDALRALCSSIWQSGTFQALVYVGFLVGVGLWNPHQPSYLWLLPLPFLAGVIWSLRNFLLLSQYQSPAATAWAVLSSVASAAAIRGLLALDNLLGRELTTFAMIFVVGTGAVLLKLIGSRTIKLPGHIEIALEKPAPEIDALNILKQVELLQSNPNLSQEDILRSLEGSTSSPGIMVSVENQPPEPQPKEKSSAHDPLGGSV